MGGWQHTYLQQQESILVSPQVFHSYPYNYYMSNTDRLTDGLESMRPLSSARFSTERGIIRATDDTVKQPCTLMYLNTLFLELCRTRAFVLTSVSNIPDVEVQHHRIQFLEHEFDRLSRYPALFPSRSIRHHFLILCFQSDCEYHFSRSLGNLLIGRELRKVRNASCTQLTRSNYVPESYGWENFLLPGGPGVPLNTKETEPRSAFQVLPGVGMRICSDLSREENDIIQFTHTTSSVATQDTLKYLPFDSPISNPRLASTADGQWSNTQLRYHTQNIILTPSPFREDLGLRLDVRGISTAPIENYSSLIYRIEQRGPGPNAPAAALNAPNMFPVMGIRSWHRPLHRWNLHYNSADLSTCD